MPSDARTVLVCGGRTYADRARLFAELDLEHERAPIGLLVHGGGNGADALAGSWAHRRGVRVVTVFADWGTYGRAAGPLRNGRMLTEHQPSLVIAFPGERGTRDMVRQARRAGVAVREIAGGGGDAV